MLHRDLKNLTHHGNENRGIGPIILLMLNILKPSNKSNHSYTLLQKTLKGSGAAKFTYADYQTITVYFTVEGTAHAGVHLCFALLPTSSSDLFCHFNLISNMTIDGFILNQAELWGFASVLPKRGQR